MLNSIALNQRPCGWAPKRIVVISHLGEENENLWRRFFVMSMLSKIIGSLDSQS